MGSGASTEIGGVRVFKVSPGSPAAESGLEVFFDFILAVNGTKMDPNQQQAFAEKIQESENKNAKLTVYNTRSNTTREVNVVPRKWAGPGLLGATVRFDVADPAESHGIRVLEVFPNSPAAHAGLVPFQDYLLGTAQSVFHDIDELVEVVTTNINQRMQVYVYNSDTETVREVILVPNSEWGGDGCIGCDIGTGLLHRIPAPRRAPGAAAPPSAVPPPPLSVATPAVSPSGTWAPAAVPTVAYPSGTGLPAPPVPGSVPMFAVPGGVPAVPSLPGGMPPIPQLPPGVAGMPAISTSGSWAPAVPAAPAPPAPQAAASPEAFVAPAAKQVAGIKWPPQPQAASTEPATAPATDEVTGITWPPAPSQPAPAEAPYAGSPGVNLPTTWNQGEPLSPNGPPGMSTGEWPRAPPSTPLAGTDAVVGTDLSAVLDSARFANLASLSEQPQSPTDEGSLL